jgi:4-hydroxy-tetrahydrodipicolinate reductase
MVYRVIQWGTGNVGSHALRAIIQRSDLELVGLRVYNPEKVGKDAGEFVGESPTGVLATDDVDALLALDADCVNYNALGTTLDEPLGQPLDDICMLLEAGFNVTSSAIDLLIYPKGCATDVQARLAAACEKGGKTFFDSGVNPGFTMDLWPITMSRISRTIDRIHIVESLSMAEYTSASAMGFMGFGQSPDAPSYLDDMHNDRSKSPFYTSLLMVADALRFELDDVRYTREVGLAEAAFDIPFGRIDAGTIAVVKISFVGIAKGRDVLVNEFVWRVTDEVRPDWHVGDKWIMRIDGDPTFDCEVHARTQLDAKRPTSLTVAMAPLNAIPTVCDAPPGVTTVLDLPVWGGGYLTGAND